MKTTRTTNYSPETVFGNHFQIFMGIQVIRLLNPTGQITLQLLASNISKFECAFKLIKFQINVFAESEILKQKKYKTMYN